MDNRRCQLCRKSKPLGSFPKSKRRYTKYKLCSECIVLKSRLKRYSVPDGYVLPRRCPICQRTFSSKVPVHFDHNHETGQFRSVLCLQCNSLLAFAKEDTRTLKRAVNYLKKHNGQ